MSVAYELTQGIAGIGRRMTMASSLPSKVRLLLLSAVALVASGCIEIEQRVKVHDDATVSVKATIKVDPQFEALVMPQMKTDLPKKAPPGVKIDFSQRIDGKAAIVMEADGEAASAMLKEDGSTTITVSDGGFMKRRYMYREVVTRSLDMPVPIRSIVSLPGSIESVSGGTKTSSDTVEFDQTNAKRGDVFAATSTAFAFSLGGGGATVATAVNSGTATWLMPVSIGSIFAGVVLLLIGWFQLRQATHSRALQQPFAVAVPAAPMSPPVEDAGLMFCSECGARNALGRKFCSQCGHDLG